MKRTIFLAIAASFISSAALALPTSNVACPPMADVQSVIQNIHEYDNYWHGGDSGPIYRIFANGSLPSSIVLWMLYQPNPKYAVLAVSVPKEDDTSGITWLSKPIEYNFPALGTVCQYSTASILEMNSVILAPTP